MQIKGTTMLQSSKLIIQSCSHLHRRLHPPPPPLRSHTTTQTPSLKTRELSRRELAIFVNSSLLLTASQTILPGISRGAPEEEEIGEQPSIKDVPSCIDSSKTPTKHAFLDISIDGDPVGRIVVGLDVDSAPFGVSRFGELVSGRAGISYRRKEFTKIMPNYVQHGGVRSYGVDAELAKSTGRDLKNDSLKQEWERARSSCPGPRNVQGSVSIIVRDPSKPPPKAKLVARGGKLVMDEEEVGVEPNGTEFVICTKDCPELDDSALVIGRVLQGMEVLQRIGQVKTVQENTSSPYFRVAKLIGDKRAVVAERGFNRPYSKILVTNCGLLD